MSMGEHIVPEEDCPICLDCRYLTARVGPRRVGAWCTLRRRAIPEKKLLQPACRRFESATPRQSAPFDY